jgi:hypothetical protein
VKVSEILGMPYSFIQISTMTSMTLELDPQGSKTIIVTSLLDSFTLDESGKDWAVQLD